MKNYVLLFVIIFMVAACSYKQPNIDESMLTMPREVAIAYLQDEGARFSDIRKCIYTNYGVSGNAYEELEYQVKPAIGRPMVWILWGEGDKRWGCGAMFTNLNVEHDYTDEEWDEAFNKICTALESLGVKRIK